MRAETGRQHGDLEPEHPLCHSEVPLPVGRATVAFEKPHRQLGVQHDRDARQPRRPSPACEQIAVQPSNRCLDIGFLPGGQRGDAAIELVFCVQLRDRAVVIGQLQVACVNRSVVLRRDEYGEERNERRDHGRTPRIIPLMPTDARRRSLRPRASLTDL